MAIAALVVLGLAATTAWHYRYHLLWQWQARRQGLQAVRSIAVGPMPDSPAPGDWVRCRFAGVEFRLPPDLASHRDSPGSRPSYVVYRHGSRRVIVDQPTDASDFRDVLETAAQLCPERPRFTMPALRRACFQASSDDFRWSMTPEEVRWHSFRVSMGSLMRSSLDGPAETLAERDPEGILHLGDGRALFVWQSARPIREGCLRFADWGDRLDPTWIRAVCQSLKIAEDAPNGAGP